MTESDDELVRRAVEGDLTALSCSSIATSDPFAASFGRS